MCCLLLILFPLGQWDFHHLLPKRRYHCKKHHFTIFYLHPETARVLDQEGLYHCAHFCQPVNFSLSLFLCPTLSAHSSVQSFLLFLKTWVFKKPVFYIDKSYVYFIFINLWIPLGILLLHNGILLFQLLQILTFHLPGSVHFHKTAMEYPCSSATFTGPHQLCRQIFCNIIILEHQFWFTCWVFFQENPTGLILFDGPNFFSGKRLLNRTGTCDSKSWHRNKVCERKWDEFVREE